MKPLYLKNVVTLQLNKDLCTGCNTCTTVCPHGVFVVDNRRADIVNRDYCIECGACAKNCPAEAISVDAGVGCASAIIRGILTNSEPVCGCNTDDKNNGCC